MRKEWILSEDEYVALSREATHDLYEPFFRKRRKRTKMQENRRLKKAQNGIEELACQSHLELVSPMSTKRHY